MTNEPEWLTPKQCARMMGVHCSCIYRHVLVGRLKAIRRAGRHYLIARKDMLAFLAGEPVVPSVRVEYPRVGKDGAA